MDKIRHIVNEDHYFEALAALKVGADYIENPEFPKLPVGKQEKAKQRYDEITNMILKYKGLI